MNILGIGGVLSDAAAVLIRNGQIAAAVEENKLTRRSQSGRLPEAAIASCLQIAGIGPDEVDYVALGAAAAARRCIAAGGCRGLRKARIVSIDHHAAHAAIGIPVVSVR